MILRLDNVLAFGSKKASSPWICIHRQGIEEKQEAKQILIYVTIEMEIRGGFSVFFSFWVLSRSIIRVGWSAMAVQRSFYSFFFFFFFFCSLVSHTPFYKIITHGVIWRVHNCPPQRRKPILSLSKCVYHWSVTNSKMLYVHLLSEGYVPPFISGQWMAEDSGHLLVSLLSARVAYGSWLISYGSLDIWPVQCLYHR